MQFDFMQMNGDYFDIRDDTL